MATFASFFAILFIASSISLVSCEAPLKNAKETCIDTPFPESCLSALSSQNESGPASEMGFAESMATATVPTLGDASRAASNQIVQNKQLSEADVRCFTKCRDLLDKAKENLDANYEDGDDIGHVKLPEIGKFLKAAKAKHVEWNCDRCRHGEQKKIVDEISKGNEAEKRIAVLEVLMDRVPR